MASRRDRAAEVMLELTTARVQLADLPQLIKSRLLDSVSGLVSHQMSLYM